MTATLERVWRNRYGVHVTEAPKTAEEIAFDFAVSLRTARRHLAKGTFPARLRKVGPNGKSYPSCARPSRSTRRFDRVALDLEMARNAVRRVARATRFNEADLSDIRTIAEEAAALLGAWEETVRLYEAEALATNAKAPGW